MRCDAENSELFPMFVIRIQIWKFEIIFTRL